MVSISSSSASIPFTRRHRWRWWVMLVMGSAFLVYGLALLTSPAWDNRGIINVDGVWLWLRGETYLVFGFMQALIGGGYIRLTSRPAEAVAVTQQGISVRRLYGTQHIDWQDVTTVRKGRTSLLVAATPISLWKLFLCDPRLMRLDTTVIDASVDDLMQLIETYSGVHQQM